MSQSFIISATVFTIVMVIFHLVKDILLRGWTIPQHQRNNFNKRWLVSTAIGLFILYLLYA
jgi:hypothetical protein